AVDAADAGLKWVSRSPDAGQVTASLLGMRPRLLISRLYTRSRARVARSRIHTPQAAPRDGGRSHHKGHSSAADAPVSAFGGIRRATGGTNCSPGRAPSQISGRRALLGRSARDASRYVGLVPRHAGATRDP